MSARKPKTNLAATMGRRVGRLCAASLIVVSMVTAARAQQTKAKIDQFPHFAVSGRVVNGDDGTPSPERKSLWPG